MYLSDKASSSLIERNRFNIDGSPLKTPAKVEGYGYKLYNVKIKETVHLENDPQFSCKNYKEITYEKVNTPKLYILSLLILVSSKRIHNTNEDHC